MFRYEGTDPENVIAAFLSPHDDAARHQALGDERRTLSSACCHSSTELVSLCFLVVVLLRHAVLPVLTTRMVTKHHITEAPRVSTNSEPTFDFVLPSSRESPVALYVTRLS